MSNLKQLNQIAENEWIDVCALSDITPNTGVTALIDDQQIALFRVGHEQRIYALSNQDPFSGANVMSRGIMGDLQGERVIASPIYKQHFSLATGRCLEDKEQKLLVFPCKVQSGRVWVSPVPQKTYITNNGLAQDKLKLVLVGNGLAGMRCLEDLLDMNPERYEITVIGEEPWGIITVLCCHLFYLVKKPLKILCYILINGIRIKPFALWRAIQRSRLIVTVSKCIPKMVSVLNMTGLFWLLGLNRLFHLFKEQT